MMSNFIGQVNKLNDNLTVSSLFAFRLTQKKNYFFPLDIAFLSCYTGNDSRREGGYVCFFQNIIVATER